MVGGNEEKTLACPEDASKVSPSDPSFLSSYRCLLDYYVISFLRPLCLSRLDLQAERASVDECNLQNRALLLLFISFSISNVLHRSRDRTSIVQFENEKTNRFRKSLTSDEA